MTLQEVIEKHIKNALYLMLDDDDMPASFFLEDEGSFFEAQIYSHLGTTDEDVKLIIRTHDGVQFFFRNNDNQNVVHDDYDFHLHDVNGIKYYVSMLNLVRIT
jgi:hypothetical protein